MHRNATNLHNKTQEVPEDELPYNVHNRLLMEDDLRKLFDGHGLRSVTFNNINLYRNAFVHKSYCTMKNDDFESGNDRCPDGCLPLQEMSYERLEFLGDAILGMVVARYLHERYPNQPEGFLSKMRTKIVNGKMLGHLAGRIGLEPFVIISKQIEAGGGRNNYKILEDTFEALIGAIYLDFQDSPPEMPASVKLEDGPLSGAGFYVAETWIISILEKNIDFAELVASRTNYKDQLVRYMQHAFQDAPRFFETRIDTVNNMKVFTYNVKNRSGTVLGTGKGASKKEAENMAARAALVAYGEYVE